jgi:alpha-mannosidase
MNQETIRLRVRELRKYLSLIHRCMIRGCCPLESFHICVQAEPRYNMPPDNAEWRPCAVNDLWGRQHEWAYFRAEACVPEAWKPGAVELHISHLARYLEPLIWPDVPVDAAGPEGLVFLDGQRIGAIDRQHRSIRAVLIPGHRHDIRAVFFAGRKACRHMIEAMELRWIDTETESLYHDLRVALDKIELLEPESTSRERMIAVVAAAMRTLDFRSISEALTPADRLRCENHTRFYDSVVPAKQVFSEGLKGITCAGDTPPPVTAVGHAHIDLAWLWSITQTKHKLIRTFATQCRLLEQYPGWVFNQSSPQAYAWVQESAPKLFERIGALVKAGRWEAEGATWVEMDTNLPSGESLVRQFLYGKKYFSEHLGVESRIFWAPDVFGYSAAMPQLMKLAGVSGFITSKISWNQRNRFPYETFRWIGIDGSEVLTHFITGPCGHESVLTYNAMMTAGEIRKIWDRCQGQHLQISPLLTFGYGDGGGGPTEEMLETFQRLSGAPTDSRIPSVRSVPTAKLIDEISSRVGMLPTWDGELYLEYHRGVFTSQAWLKRANRKNEVRMHSFEWVASLAGEFGFEFDKDRHDTNWKDLLLNQFHDILPGSSVREVYDEARPVMQRIANDAESMTSQAANVLAEQIDTAEMKCPVVLFNTLSADRHDPVKLPDGTWRDDITIPAGGWAVIDTSDMPDYGQAGGTSLQIDRDARELSNRFWRLRLNDHGQIIELYDQENDRQVLPSGAVANQWQVFEDRPMSLDAWNIGAYYGQHPLPSPKCVAINVVETGPVRVAVECQWELPRIGPDQYSKITQCIVLYANSPRIDFETRIDWHDHHQLLKVAFPVDIRATEATYEIQYGHVKRSTHSNTSWDQARYEVCAHRFVDLSEHGYGVALLNDCKYGYDIHGHVMRMTCIKSAQVPDETADQGRHVFTYAILPHKGAFQEAGVIQAAVELNVPPIIHPTKPSTGRLPSCVAAVKSDHPAIVVDTLKSAEDGEGVIARLYESHGSHAKGAVHFKRELRDVKVVDLLEQHLDDDVDLRVEHDRVHLRLRPFQIVSLRIRMAWSNGIFSGLSSNVNTLSRGPSATGRSSATGPGGRSG